MWSFRDPDTQILRFNRSFQGLPWACNIEGFVGWAWRRLAQHTFSHITLLDLDPMAASNCKGGWEMSSSYVTGRKRNWVWWSGTNICSRLCGKFKHCDGDAYKLIHFTLTATPQVVTIFILQVKKLRLKEMKWLAQGYVAPESGSQSWSIFFFFFSGCIGSLLLRTGSLQLRQAGATLGCSAWASHCSALPCCGARAPGARASAVVARGLQSAGSAAVVHRPSCSTHVGSSRTRARTRVPCIGRRIPNHCATREAPRVEVLLPTFFHYTHLPLSTIQERQGGRESIVLLRWSWFTYRV